MPLVDPTGATLHPYQVYAKDFIKTHPRCGLFLDMGLGKAMDDDTVIPTPDGFRRLGDIQVNDLVYDMYGNPFPVEAVFKHKNKTAYQVTLDDGRSFVCCNEHLIPILRNDVFRGCLDAVPLQNIIDDWANTPGGYRKVYNVPQCSIVNYPEKQHDVPPDVLGILLRTATVEDGWIRLKPIADVPAEGSRVIHAYKCLEKAYGAIVDAGDHLRFLDQAVNDSLLLLVPKSVRQGNDVPLGAIPMDYVMDSAQNRCHFLMGYFLVDDKDDPLSQLKHSLTIPNQDIVEPLALMIRSLGFDCSVKYRPRLKVWEMRCELRQPKSHSHFITDIKPVKSRDMTCFTVGSPTSTYLVNDYIVTHNTRVTLQALYEMNPRNHVLVIAPKNIARATWLREIQKWGYPLRFESFVCNTDNFRDLTRKTRLQKYGEILSTPPSLYFINQELVTDLVDNMPIVNGRPVWPFPSVVIDELQAFKGYKSKRFKAMKYVNPAISQFIGLTGTPTPNDLMDLWPEIFLMDGGARLGPNITWYRNTFFKELMRVNGYPVKWAPLPGAEDEIYRRIGDIVISMKNTLSLPPVTYNDFPVFMEEDELAQYKAFAKTAVFELDEDHEVTAVNAAVLKNKLCQMASGTLYTDPETKAYVVIHQRKLEACRYIIDNSSDGVLIAYHFKSELDQLLDYLPEARVFDGSPKMQDEWNAGQVPVMLIQPASAGHGLNLQDGGHTIIWYSIYPNLEQYLQTNARLARQGQTKPVVIHHLLTENTVDNAMLGLLHHKDMSQEGLLSAVRVAVREVFD